MNQTIEELLNRKSVRVYSDELITQDERRLILESALQAPSAGNMTLYSIIDIQNQEIKEELSIRCDHQPFIAKAPLVLIFVADYQKWFDIFNKYTKGKEKLQESDLFLAMEDALIAAQNTVVAAESLGIGSCYIGDILENFEDNQKLLNLPKYVVPIAMVVYGKPTQQQKERKKPRRFDLEDIVCIDTYQHKSIEETVCMFEKQTQKTGEELESYIQAFAERKFFAEFRDEMNRSSRAILKHWLK